MRLSIKYLAIAVLCICEFAGAQAPPALQRLVGVFRATVQPNQYAYLTFFPDGRVRRSYPGEGLDGWDDAYWMNLDMRSGIASKILTWGTYSISGSQAQIVFTNRDTWTVDISRFPQWISTQGAMFYILDPGSGMVLNGTYRSVNGDALIRFAPDGSLVEQGLVANCVNGGPHVSYGGAVPSVNSGSQLCLNQPVAGRYTIGYYTLHLGFADGTKPSFAFWGEPNQDRANMRTIYINNIRYDQVQ